MENAKLMSELKSQERSIAWLGRQLNITRAYMHKMINGKRNFSEIYKKKCANALNIDYTDLFNNVWLLDSVFSITQVHRAFTHMVPKTPSTHQGAQNQGCESQKQQNHQTRTEIIIRWCNLANNSLVVPIYTHWGLRKAGEEPFLSLFFSPVSYEIHNPKKQEV